MGPPCPYRDVHTQTVPERQISLFIISFPESLYFIIIILLLAALGLHCYLQAFSSCPEQGLLSSCDAQAYSLQWLLLLQSMGSKAWASVAVPHKCAGLVVPQHVGSSWTRDQTHVLCTGRRILNH